MAEGTRANYASVGLTVIIGVAAIVWALVHFGGQDDDRNLFFCETSSATAVSGLSVGSAVNFRGVKIGKVQKISFIGAEYDVTNPADDRRVYVEMALDRELCRLDSETPQGSFFDQLLADGLRVTLSANAITGIASLEMSLPSKDVPDSFVPEKISWKPRTPYVPCAPSMLESMSDSMKRAMAKLNNIDFVVACSNVSQTAASAARLMENVEKMLDAESSTVGTILNNLDRASESLRVFADELRDNPSLILRERDSRPLPETRR